MTQKELLQYPLFEVLNHFKEWYSKKYKNDMSRSQFSFEALCLQCGFSNENRTQLRYIAFKRQARSPKYQPVVCKYIATNYPDFNMPDGVELLPVKAKKAKKVKSKSQKSKS